jgi:peptidylprolyl isomerase
VKRRAFRRTLAALGLGLALGSGALSAAAQEGVTWRQVPPENLVFIGMREGEIVLELNPTFAPQTVARFRQKVRDGFFRGMSFYRVIEGFVAQAGPGGDIPVDEEDFLPAEFQLSRGDELPWVTVQRDAFFAPETGFIDGFPAARDDRHVWLTHCPGAVAVARGNEPDSGARDFYIVIGQAPRYLDRNLTVFARVIDGMEVAQRIQRGPTENNGIIDNDLARSRISRMRLADQLEPEERRDFYVMDTTSRGFRAMMEERRDRDHAFFVNKPPAILDVCQVPVATRVEKAGALLRRPDGTESN